jgi:hypothetical protein
MFSRLPIHLLIYSFAHPIMNLFSISAMPRKRHKTLASVVLTTAWCCLLLGCVLGCLSTSLAHAIETEKHSLTLPEKGIAIYAAGDIADCGKRPAKESAAAKTAAIIMENWRTTKRQKC